MMSIVETVLFIVILVAWLGITMRLHGWSLSRIAIFIGFVIVIGVIAGTFATLASSPHPPAWAKGAMPFVGALSGAGFVLLFILLRFWKR
jgi:hypothetical protein